jgi:hypothetical protein
MGSTNKWWLAVPLAVGLVVAACGGDDDSADDGATEAPADAAATEEEQPADGANDTEAAADTAASAGVIMLGDEEIAIEGALCYFEEQERAGLGGVWTHTSQASGTNEAGAPVTVGLDRARNEDETVEDSVYVNIGEPTADDFVGLTADGPEGLIEFGESSVSAQDVEVAEFGSDPVSLSISFDC